MGFVCVLYIYFGAKGCEFGEFGDVVGLVQSAGSHFFKGNFIKYVASTLIIKICSIKKFFNKIYLELIFLLKCDKNIYKT